ncbi:MAG TPA: TolC family protein [Gemmatimonadaceae bacterium]|nr:TolC family protein [Gemmatimonadaceae bacterium]
MHRWIIAAASAAIVAFAPAPSAAQRPVTRADAIAAALARGPRLAIAAADTSAARAVLLGARAYANPTLNLSATKDAPQRHIYADIPLDFPWLRRARVGSATAARAAALDQFALQRAAITFDAETTYVNAVVSDARARLSRRNAQDADSLRRIAVARRAAGDASDLDVELATIAAGGQENQALADSLTAAASLLDLQAVMGDFTGAVTIALADTLSWSDTAVGAADGTPLAVRAAQHVVTATDRAVDAERRSVWGTASVQLGVDFHDPTQSGYLPVIGIALPFPLFNQNQSGVAAAEADRDRARAELRLIQLESARDIARVTEAQSIAQQRVARDRQLLAGANRVAAMALTAYREGESALPAVLEAQRSARDTLGQYIDDVGAANAAAAALRLLTASASGIP